MEISVKMTEDEFQEYMLWKRDRTQYIREMEKLRRIPEVLATSLHFAVEPVEGRGGRYKIVSQEHMADAMDAAAEFMPN